jgi:hypothetical protein
MKLLLSLVVVGALAWLFFGALVWVINLPFLIGVVGVWLLVVFFAGGKSQ